MKRVLIIGYFWPYVGGSKRIIGLAKFLLDFGWEPIILTGPLQGKPDQQFRIIETNYSGFLGFWSRIFGLNPKIDLGDQLKSRMENTSLKIKNFLKFFYNPIRGIIAYPDEYRGWKKFAIRAAEELFLKEKIDAIISVYPITSHFIARELKKKYHIPWIADFPDLWSENAAYPYGPIRKFFDKKLERKTIKSADAIITSSPIYVEKLQKIHKSKQIYPIGLGFDPEILNIPPVPLINKFIIAYTGIFYSKKRNPYKFFAAIKELLSEKLINHDDFEVRFYGPKSQEIEKEISKYKLEKVAKQYGEVSFEECIKKQRESQLLLQLNWEDEKDRGVFSGKMIDYLAACRPILAAGGSGKDEVVKKMLLETGAGVYCPKKEDIKKTLHQFYSEYKQTGKVKYNGDIEKVKKFSQLEMARKFVEILERITKK